MYILKLEGKATGSRIGAAHRRIAAALIAAWLLGMHSAGAAADCGPDLSLSELTPRTVWAYNPAQDVRPRATAVQSRDGSQEPAVQFISQSRITYVVPSGQSIFSGTAIYESSPALLHPRAERLGYAIWLKILVDGDIRLQSVLDSSTPPLEFRIPVTPASVLTVQLQGHFGWDSLYVVDPGFSREQCPTYSRSSLASGEGYVAFADVQQALFHALKADSLAPLLVNYRGNIERVQIHLRLAAEQTQFPDYSWDTPVRFDSNDADRRSATIQWPVPRRYGPAVLDVALTVNGRTVFTRHNRVALIPSNNVAALADSGFGVHTSTAGFSFAQDSAVSLWGAKWDRAYVAWNILQPTKDAFDFSRIDDIVSTLRGQGISVLGVLGEHSPSWAGTPGPDFYAAWKNYVSQTVKHFKGSIDHWDVFNEVDVKYYDKLRAADPDADVALLRSATEIIRHECPACKIVCCSTGTANWLGYDMRILPTLLPRIDFLSWHPYRYVAPEEKQGFLDYLGEVAELSMLARSEGAARSLWASEANWIIGPQAAGVTNPEMDEHTQAEYVVRVNLLSQTQGLPFFLHSPFYHSQHTAVQLDTWSAYAQMAHLFSDAARSTHLALSEGGVYAVEGEKPSGSIGAVWTSGAAATVAVSGVSSPSFLDMYGNLLHVDSQRIPVSGAPIYFTAPSGPLPKVSVVRSARPRNWTLLPAWSEWSRNKASSYQNVENGGIQVTSEVSQYASQLVSPAVPVRPGGCYVVRMSLRVDQGAIGVFGTDSTTGKRTSEPIFVTGLTEHDIREAQFRILMGSSATAMKVVVSDGNLVPATSSFLLGSTAEIAPCQ